jgi:hypothetical protein
VFEFEFGEYFLEFVGEGDKERNLFDKRAYLSESVRVFDGYFFGDFSELG